MLLTLDQKKIIDICENILSKYGTKGVDNILGRDCDCVIYKDSVIEIYQSIDKYEMEVVRCSEQLPIILKQHGEYILFHAFYVYLEYHLTELMNKGT